MSLLSLLWCLMFLSPKTKPKCAMVTMAIEKKSVPPVEESLLEESSHLPKSQQSKSLSTKSFHLMMNAFLLQCVTGVASLYSMQREVKLSS